MTGLAEPRVTIVGAGIGGLCAAVDLARQGAAVTVLERAAAPGGKMREVEVGGRRLDAGPTVFTLRRVFDELFDAAGASLDDAVTLRSAQVLARHAWDGSGFLDLFADRQRSAEAIGAFAGPDEGRRYLAFCDEARRIFTTLDRPFIRAAVPSLPGLVGGVGLGNLGELWRIKPFTTLWRALGQSFRDPRLQQLFGRYATYCGSSPFQAPATLMLVAHVEQEGVWLVEGGMHRLALALAGLATRLGATIRYGCEAREITVERGRVGGVVTAEGERVAADAVIANGDVAAVTGGLLGAAVTGAAPATDPRARSLSAVTWCMAASSGGFPLARHNVFFSADYPAEFADILERDRLPAAPTVYVCAQDRGDPRDPRPTGAERLFCLVNAPASGDRRDFGEAEVGRAFEAMHRLFRHCGLEVRPEAVAVTTPNGFNRLFPGTGGALYGRASHGWKASFERPACRTRVPGLYLAGGSIHPGPGVPMAALSGRAAAACLLADLASTAPSRRAATAGGMSTR